MEEFNDEEEEEVKGFQPRWKKIFPGNNDGGYFPRE